MKNLVLPTMLVLMTSFWLSWCGWQNSVWDTTAIDVVWNWDTVKVDYIWSLAEDWSVFDTNIESVAKENWSFTEWRPYEPLEFTVWARQMIPWFDNGVVWMKLWQTKKIAISAEDGYWERSEDAIQEVPSDMFAQAWIEPIVWEQIVLNSPMGPIPGTVVSVSTWTTTVDMNHFLAWKELKFEVTITEINKALSWAVEELLTWDSQ